MSKRPPYATARVWTKERRYMMSGSLPSMVMNLFIALPLDERGQVLADLQKLQADALARIEGTAQRLAAAQTKLHCDALATSDAPAELS